jgi:signal transduction histidine kinase
MMSAKAEQSRETFEYITQQLLRQVAHDIRSPAGLVLNALEEVTRCDTGEERDAMLAVANRSVQRLIRLADRLSMVSELQHGVLFERPLGDLRALLECSTAQALTLHGRRNVRLERDFGTAAVQLPHNVRWLSAATTEVVANALRYARSQVRVSMIAGETTVKLVIEDDGPGFSSDFNITHAFQTRTGVQGLGLSLALAADVCAGHQGALKIHTSTLPLFREGTPGAAVTLELSRAV